MLKESEMAFLATSDIGFNQFPAPELSLIDYPKASRAKLLNMYDLWWYPDTEISEVYNNQSLRREIIEWIKQDTEDGWSCLYFRYLSNKEMLKVVKDTIGEELTEEQLIEESKSEYYTLQNRLISQQSHKYWNDEIEGFPINHEANELYDCYDIQVCYDEMMYHKADFIINLCAKYCPDWHFNSKKNNLKKRQVVFTFQAEGIEGYVWSIVISSKRLGYDTIEVLLVKDSDKAIKRKDVVFQLLFPLYFFPRLGGGNEVNVWKLNIDFRYYYIQRYIKFITPLIDKNLLP